MELNYMRFNGRAFGYCTREISLGSDREIKTYRLCGGENVLQNYGRDLRVVKGKGEIPEPAEKEMRRMRRMFVLGDRGALVIPGHAPFYAVLRRLEFSAQDGGVMGYEFEFCELPRGTQTAPEYLTHTAAKGENLWTIARMYGRTVEELVELNPQIARPDRIETDQEVRVRWR